MSYSVIIDEKYNQEYSGHAEACTYTFTVNLPDQMGASWRAQDLIDAHVTELTAQGAIILELKVWEDTAPTFETNYMVRVVSSASPLFWQIIVAGVIALLGIIFVYLSIKSVEEIVEYSPGAAISLGIGAAALGILGIMLLSGSGSD